MPAWLCTNDDAVHSIAATNIKEIPKSNCQYDPPPGEHGFDKVWSLRSPNPGYVASPTMAKLDGSSVSKWPRDEPTTHGTCQKDRMHSVR